MVDRGKMCYAGTVEHLRWQQGGVLMSWPAQLGAVVYWSSAGFKRPWRLSQALRVRGRAHELEAWVAAKCFSVLRLESFAFGRCDVGNKRVVIGSKELYSVSSGHRPNERPSVGHMPK